MRNVPIREDHLKSVLESKAFKIPKIASLKISWQKKIKN